MGTADAWPRIRRAKLCLSRGFPGCPALGPHPLINCFGADSPHLDSTLGRRILRQVAS